MNKVLKVATLAIVAIVTINFFTACSKEKDTPSINVEQLYQNINGNYIGTVKLSLADALKKIICSCGLKLVIMTSSLPFVAFKRA